MTTWGPKGYFGMAQDGDVAGRVRDAIGQLVDDFTVQWARDNPRE